jgi:hypothetical protein
VPRESEESCEDTKSKATNGGKLKVYKATFSCVYGMHPRRSSPSLDVSVVLSLSAPKTQLPFLSKASPIIHTYLYQFLHSTRIELTRARAGSTTRRPTWAAPVHWPWSHQ